MYQPKFCKRCGDIYIETVCYACGIRYRQSIDMEGYVFQCGKYELDVFLSQGRTRIWNDDEPLPLHINMVLPYHFNDEEKLDIYWLIK